MSETNVLIIGSGLSGLHTAYELQKHGIDFHLIEARERLGGRVFSLNETKTEYDPNDAAFDLGPSWFWPGQVHMQGLLKDINLEHDVFSQASNGHAIFEDNHGNIQRGIGGISMAGAFRLKGGIRQITSKLEQLIPTSSIQLNAIATEIKFQQDKIITTVTNADKTEMIYSDYVVLALPPRVALSSISFTPNFSETRQQQLNTVATWMAGHAKMIFIYKNKFWQEQGLSGDAISYRGPLHEIHDASSESDNLCALFGFVSVQAKYRRNREDELKALATTQLTRLFGESAKEIKEIHLKDWASDPFTATEYDQEIQTHHPMNNIGEVCEKSWQQKLIWSGSESADFRNHNNGFLEGALEASKKTVSILIKHDETI